MHPLGASSPSSVSLSCMLTNIYHFKGSLHVPVAAWLLIWSQTALPLEYYFIILLFIFWTFWPNDDDDDDAPLMADPLTVTSSKDQLETTERMWGIQEKENHTNVDRIARTADCQCWEHWDIVYVSLLIPLYVFFFFLIIVKIDRSNAITASANKQSTPAQCFFKFAPRNRFQDPSAVHPSILY